MLSRPSVFRGFQRPWRFSLAILLPGVLCVCFARQRIDGVVASVGDSVILYSELQAYTVLKMGGVIDTTIDSVGLATLRQNSLDELIDGKVLLVHAEKDSNIVVTENEVDAQLDARIQAIIRQNNLTPEAFEEVLVQQQGISLSKFKAEVRKQIRQELIKQKVQQHYVSMGTLGRSDVEAFFREYKDSLPPVGQSVRFSMVSISVTPSDKIRQKAYDKIVAIKERLDNGQDFSAVAQQYSEGPNASMGGDLGFIAKGTLNILAFEEKAFSMEPGVLSDIFETRLGFHVILVTERRDQMVHVKQIFVAVKPPEEMVERTMALLDSIATHARTREDFVKAVREHSTDKISKSRDGLVGWREVASLSPSLRAVIDSLEPGEISAPLRLENTLTIYRVEEKRDSRPQTLEDDWNEIATIAERIVAQKKLLELVKKWRRETFIDIRI